MEEVLVTFFLLFAGREGEESGTSTWLIVSRRVRCERFVDGGILGNKTYFCEASMKTKWYRSYASQRSVARARGRRRGRLDFKQQFIEAGLVNKMMGM